MEERLKQLDKEELIDLIMVYNDYILDFDEEFNSVALDRTPVCVMEFYDNEYKELRKEVN
jgi:hypothetical protein